MQPNSGKAVFDADSGWSLVITGSMNLQCFIDMWCFNNMLCSLTDDS